MFLRRPLALAGKIKKRGHKGLALYNRNSNQALACSFFHVRFGALVTSPFLRALAVTRMYRTSPLMRALTRCRFGMKRRLVIAVMCVPMPPFFFALPLRQIWLPLMDPFPVSSQILDIKFLLFQERVKVAISRDVASYFSQMYVAQARMFSLGINDKPEGHPKTTTAPFRPAGTKPRPPAI